MTKELYRDRWMVCYENDQGISYVVMHDGTLAVPVTESGEALLITEDSPAYDERLLSLPGGMIDPGEQPADTINRELQEEIGLKAGRLDFLMAVRPFSKYMHLQLHLYLARDLVPSRLQGDEQWAIEVEQVPLSSVESLMASGRLRDSNVILALYLARRFLAAGN